MNPISIHAKSRIVFSITGDSNGVHIGFCAKGSPLMLPIYGVEFRLSNILTYAHYNGKKVTICAEKNKVLVDVDHKVTVLHVPKSIHMCYPFVKLDAECGKKRVKILEASGIDLQGIALMISKMGHKYNLPVDVCTHIWNFLW